MAWKTNCSLLAMPPAGILKLRNLLACDGELFGTATSCDHFHDGYRVPTTGAEFVSACRLIICTDESLSALYRNEHHTMEEARLAH